MLSLGNLFGGDVSPPENDDVAPDDADAPGDQQILPPDSDQPNDLASNDLAEG